MYSLIFFIFVIILLLFFEITWEHNILSIKDNYKVVIEIPYLYYYKFDPENKLKASKIPLLIIFHFPNCLFILNTAEQACQNFSIIIFN